MKTLLQLVIGPAIIAVVTSLVGYGWIKPDWTLNVAGVFINSFLVIAWAVFIEVNYSKDIHIRKQ